MSIFLNGIDRTPVNSLVLLNAAAGNEVANRIDYTVNKAAGDSTGLLINITPTSVPGTNYILALQTSGTDVFSVRRRGILVGTATLNLAAGNEAAWTLNYTTNKAAGNDTGLLINMTDTASPGTSLLVDAQVGGSSKFYVDNTGKLLTIYGIFNGYIETNSITALASDSTFILQGKNFTGTDNAIEMAYGTFSGAGVTQAAVVIKPTWNQTTTSAGTDLLINRTQTAVGSGAQLLIDAQVGSVSKFSVSNTGVVSGSTINKQFSNKCAADLLGIMTSPKALYSWQGTPGNGLTESDLSGAGHTATFVGAGWAAADKVNKGFGFVLDPDGASYINLGDSDDFSFAAADVDGAFSIGGVIEVVATATYQMVATKYDDTTGAEAREWQIYVSTDETFLILLIDESANVTCFRVTDAALSAGFHTFAITCSSVSAGASRANDILIYVDGAVVASTATNDAAYVAMENLATPCWIGAREGAGGTPEYYMQGDIGTLMIDKGTVWTAAQIWRQHLYSKSLYNL